MAASGPIYVAHFRVRALGRCVFVSVGLDHEISRFAIVHSQIRSNRCSGNVNRLDPLVDSRLVCADHTLVDCHGKGNPGRQTGHPDWRI